MYEYIVFVIVKICHRLKYRRYAQMNRDIYCSIYLHLIKIWGNSTTRSDRKRMRIQ